MASGIPQLFRDRQRNSLRPIEDGEPNFKYLNETGREGFNYVRDTLQSWFDSYDTENSKRKDLRRRFCSNDDQEHYSAFFELYLYTLLRRIGYSVEVEPKWSRGKPDFLVTSPSGQKILIEATTMRRIMDFAPKREIKEIKVFAIDNLKPYRNKLSSKGTRYGTIDIPYLVAVNDDVWFTDEEDISESLFGQIGLEINWDTAETRTLRLPNGVWYGPSGYQMQKVSGLLVFRGLRPTNLHLKDPVIWHHPYAIHPISPELLPFTQKVPNNQLGRLETRNGQSTANILGIAPDKMPY